MRFKNSYRITFDTKKGGYKNWVIDTEAYNAKEAREYIEKLWASFKSYNLMHKFHIKVRRLKYTEEFLYHTFVESFCITPL